MHKENVCLIIVENLTLRHRAFSRMNWSINLWQLRNLDFHLQLNIILYLLTFFMVKLGFGLFTLLSKRTHNIVEIL